MPVFIATCPHREATPAIYWEPFKPVILQGVWLGAVITRAVWIGERCRTADVGRQGSLGRRRPPLGAVGADAVQLSLSQPHQLQRFRPFKPGGGRTTTNRVRMEWLGHRYHAHMFERRADNWVRQEPLLAGGWNDTQVWSKLSLVFKCVWAIGFGKVQLVRW